MWEAKQTQVHGNRDGVGVETCQEPLFRDAAQKEKAQASLDAELFMADDLEACEKLLKHLLCHEDLFRSDAFRSLRGLVMQLAGRLWKGKAMASAASEPVAEEREEAWEVCEVRPAQMSRLLYTNPVCILSSCNGGVRNLMTISWITPIDNHGRMSLCCIVEEAPQALEP